MRLLPRLRLLLARRPWLYWLVVGLCASVVWLSVSAAAEGVEAERARWGTTQRVWVTSAPVAAGSSVVAVARDYPQAMVPSAALTEEPVGVATHALAAGDDYHRLHQRRLQQDRRCSAGSRNSDGRRLKPERA